jgi:hypothetical protein
MSVSRSAANRRASTACGSPAGSAEEAFVFDARSTADADDLSGDDVERSKAQVFDVAGSSQTAREFARESARAAAKFSSMRRKPEPNQRLEPTRLAGAVFPARPLRSTSTCGSKSRDCARQRVAHH